MYRVSINGDDWTEVEAISAAHAASDACLSYIKTSNERREIDLLIVRKAERVAVSRRRTPVVRGRQRRAAVPEPAVFPGISMPEGSAP